MKQWRSSTLEEVMCNTLRCFGFEIALAFGFVCFSNTLCVSPEASRVMCVSFSVSRKMWVKIPPEST